MEKELYFQFLLENDVQFTKVEDDCYVANVRMLIQKDQVHEQTPEEKTKETEMLKDKIRIKTNLLKEVKDIQAESEQRLKKLIIMAEKDFNDTLDENDGVQDKAARLSYQISDVKRGLKTVAKKG